MYRAMPLRQPQSLHRSPASTSSSIPCRLAINRSCTCHNFSNSDPEQPNRTLSCEFPEACEDCSVHTRRTADPLSVHWHPRCVRDRNLVGFLQRGAHRGLDTGTCSGCPAAVARSCVHDNLCFMVSRECASACTLSTRLRHPGLLPGSDFWIARRQHVVHPHLGAELKQHVS